MIVKIYRIGTSTITLEVAAGTTVGTVLETANISAEGLFIKVNTVEASVSTVITTDSDIILSAKVKGGIALV